MGIARFSAIVLTVLVLVVSGASASGFENTGIGMKARGMGGAFRSVADDWTAAYYNPAGYAWIWDNQLGSSWGFLHYRDEIVPNVRWGGVYERGIYNDRVNYNAHEVLSNPSAGIVIRTPVFGETVFGLSAYQRFDQNISWTLFKPLPSYSTNAALPQDQYSTNLDVVTFQLTAAKELVEDQLAVGLGLQLNRGDLIYSTVYQRHNPITNSPNNPLYDIMQDYPYDRVTQWSKVDGYGWGFGLNGGLLYRVNEKLNVGVNVNLPFSISIDGDAQNIFYLPENEDLWRNADSAAIGNPGTVGQLFLSGARVHHVAEFETDLDLPASLGFGVSYRANDNLTLAFDAEYVLWSSYEGLAFTFLDGPGDEGLTGPADTAAIARNFFTADVSAPVDWSNAGKVALGMSYDIFEFLGPEVDLTLVGGVSADQSPARDVDQFTPQFIDTGDKYSFNAGAIFHIERWDLGIVTSYTKQPDLTLTGVKMADTFERFPGDYSAETYETILSFNYRF